LILPASRHVHLDRVKELLDSHDVRLATEAELEEYFADCELGAIPPLRHWQGVAVLMDESMRVAGEIVFPAGTHRDAVRVDFQDWFDLVQPRVESFCDGR
jgi:Ala-tRNA(Pro) deacylase